MGLDMYLNKKTYVKNWEHMKADRLHKITIKRGGKIRKEIKPERISYIIEEVAYWRKANAIHDWFIRECGDGDDDCRDMYVSSDDLKRLVETCKKVVAASKLVKGKIKNGYTYEDGKEVPIMEDGEYIEDATVAKELLPTAEGFFFGSTDYDEYYLADVKETIAMLEPLLAEEGDGDYSYRASW